MQKSRKEVNGTSYRTGTPKKFIEVLENARTSFPKQRLILDWGDIKTGQSWGETNDLRGTIGRSTGTLKIPILIKTTRSMGGGAILENCIVKITDSKTKQILYIHKHYKAAEK